MFLNIHWHPKPKEFFKCYDYFFKAPLKPRARPLQSFLKNCQNGTFKPMHEIWKKGSYYFFWTAKKVPLSGFIQNMYQASSKWWNKWIKMDKLDFFKNHNIKKKLSVLAFYEYLKILEGKIRRCFFIYVKRFWNNSVALLTDYGRPVRKSPSLHGQKSNPNPKFIDTAKAYFVCHNGSKFQISLI